MENLRRKLVLENGESFIGDGFGAKTDAVGEIVFNTSMTGYQEILSDPVCADQLIVMSYPLIGNYGITDEDYESKTLSMRALIVREYNDCPSNFRYTKTLSELLEENNVPGLQNIDTRKLVRILRSGGVMRAVLCGAEVSDEEAVSLARKYVRPTDQAKRVGCKKRWYSRTPNHCYNVVAVDCGIKFSYVRQLNSRGCNVTMVPCTITADEVSALRADGLFLSDGPGDPADVPELKNLVKELRGKIPVMGVGLGCQSIALACGAKTLTLKSGHRGCNHPVLERESGRIEVFAQNHGFAIEEKSLRNTGLSVTHTNLIDGTVEGVEDKKNCLFGVQFQPENATGPEDSVRAFDKFICIMQSWRTNNAKEN